MTQKKILIVEDEHALNEAYQTILQKEGYAVMAAYDGEEALQVVEEFEPDLILLDLRMPRMNGIDFLQRYEHSGHHKMAKVVVFSNLDTQKEIDDAYALGVQKYMLKAWASPKELARLVREMLTS